MAYTTAAEVRSTYMGVGSSSDDTLITALIARAQAIIDRYTGRTFEAAADSVRYFDAVADVDGAWLLLDEDLCAITSVVNGDGVTVTSAQYIGQPANSTPYYALKLLGSSNVFWTHTTDSEKSIVITGKWAYSTSAPADIVQACIRLTVWLYRQKDTNADTDRPLLTGDGVTIMPSRMPHDVEGILKPYVKII